MLFTCLVNVVHAVGTLTFGIGNYFYGVDEHVCCPVYGEPPSFNSNCLQMVWSSINTIGASGGNVDSIKIETGLCLPFTFQKPDSVYVTNPEGGVLVINGTQIPKDLVQMDDADSIVYFNSTAPSGQRYGYKSSVKFNLPNGTNSLAYRIVYLWYAPSCRYINGYQYIRNSTQASGFINQPFDPPSILLCTPNLPCKGSKGFTKVIDKCSFPSSPSFGNNNWYILIGGVVSPDTNNTGTFTNMGAGNYTMIIVDSISLNQIAIQNFVITEPDLITDTINVTACDSYLWSANNFNYTTSGTYSFTIPNATANGCDSVAVLNLTINNSTTNTTTIAACDSYTWSVNNNAYTQSGTYTYLSTNAFGCTNTEILILTINPSPTVTASNVNACAGYPVTLTGSPVGGVWNLPNPYTGGANSYTYTFTDTNGCTGSATASITTGSAIINNLTIMNVLGVSATATWSPIAGVAWFEIRYRTFGSSTWIVSTTGSNSIKVLSNLTQNTTYEVQVRGFCTMNNVGAWSPSVLFTTTNACGVPTGLFVTNISGSTAKLNWTSTGASFYTIRYKKISAATWLTVTSPSVYKVIAGLLSNSNYEFQVKSTCGSSSSSFSTSGYFTTTNSKPSQSTIEDNLSEDTWLVYPNPTHKSINIDYSSQKDKLLNFHLMDMSGRILKTISVEISRGQNQIPMELSDVSNGIYMLEIFDENNLMKVILVVKE